MASAVTVEPGLTITTALTCREGGRVGGWVRVGRGGFERDPSITHGLLLLLLVGQSLYWTRAPRSSLPPYLPPSLPPSLSVSLLPSVAHLPPLRTWGQAPQRRRPLPPRGGKAGRRPPEGGREGGRERHVNEAPWSACHPGCLHPPRQDVGARPLGGEKEEAGRDGRRGEWAIYIYT